jgi:16S rRNA processing protein RimM
VVAPEAWVPLAEVARPHGVRGELRLRLYNADSDLLLDLDEVLLRPAEGSEVLLRPAVGSEVLLRVEGARRANDAILMKLVSVDDRDRADELRGAAVCAKRADFPPLEEGEFYACDVEGARVVVEGGDELGTVAELRTYPTVDVLVVTATDGGRAWEVPLVDSVVLRVDVEAKLVTVATRDGIERA